MNNATAKEAVKNLTIDNIAPGIEIALKWSALDPCLNFVRVLAVSEKAIKIVSVEPYTKKRECWIPKKGLIQHEKAVSDWTYRDHFTVADWFKRKMSFFQMKALGYME